MLNPAALRSTAKGAAAESASSGAPWIVGMTALALLSLALPALLIEMPPVLDYPNHYARMWLIAGGAEVEPLSRFYAADWTRASMNVAVDLVAWAFGPMVGVERLAPALLAASLILPPLGAVVLHRTLFREWHWWQVGFAVLGWSATALLGFMNFQMGLGAALLAAALDPFLQRRSAATAVGVRLILAGVLLVFHPYAVAFYAAVLGGLALGDDFRWRGQAFRAIRKGILRAAPVLLLLGLAFLVAPNPPGSEQDGMPPAIWRPLVGVLFIPFTSISTYGFAFDFPVLALAALIIVLAWSRRRLRVHSGLLWTAALLLAVNTVMPFKLTDNFYSDYRLPIMAWLLAAAAVKPELTLSARHAQVAGAALLAVCLARTGAVTAIWSARQADVAAVRRAIAYVPPGATVLPVITSPPRAVEGRHPLGRLKELTPTIWHYATLVIPERRAFSPTLFTAAGKQPLRVLPPYDRIDSPNAPLVDLAALRRPDGGLSPRADHLWRWRETFDYVLILHVDEDRLGRPEKLPDGLLQVTDEGLAELHRVVRPAAQPSR